MEKERCHMRFHIKKTFAKDLLLYSNGLACSKGGECSDAAFSRTYAVGAWIPPSWLA